MRMGKTPDNISNEKDAFEKGRTHERRRLARELHDGVLQVLANVALRLDGTRKWLRQVEEKPPEDLELSLEEVRESIKEMREVLTGDPEVHSWEPGTLQKQLQAEIRELSTNAALRIDLKTNPTSLPVYEARLEREVFFATREALRNVAHHSGATEARLILRSTRDALSISLIDNGPGFQRARGPKNPSRSSPGTPHYGLKSIASRINELGGRISISSSAERGTTMLLSIPAGQVDRQPPSSGRRKTFGKRALAVSLTGSVIAGVIAAAILTPRAGEEGPPPSKAGMSPAVAHSIITPRSPTANPLEISVNRYQRASEALVTGWHPKYSPFERLDLSDWNYEIIARKSREEEGLKSRAFVYQNRRTKKLLIAEEFAGARVSDRRVRNIEAHDQQYATFNDDGVYSIAWNEDDVLYVLTSSLSEKKLVELAEEVTREEVAGNFPNE